MDIITVARKLVQRYAIQSGKDVIVQITAKRRTIHPGIIFVTTPQVQKYVMPIGLEQTV